MSVTARAAGVLGQIESLRPGDHVCWAVSSDAEHRRVLSSYFAEGLRAGDRLAYFGDRYRLDDVLSYLAGIGADGRDLIDRGALVVIDARQAYVPDGRFVPERMLDTFRGEAARARADGFRALRAAGETEWLLDGFTDPAVLTAYELAADRVTLESPLVGLCSYDTRACDGGALAAAAAVHACRTGSVSLDFCLRAAAGGRFALDGEVDISGADAFEAALHAAARTSEGEVVVDLSELRFMDVQGMKRLARMSQVAPSVRLTGAPDPLRRCWSILRYDQLANVVFA